MIKSLILTNFRNHIFSHFEIDDSKVIFVGGNNGSGKTAILESISMFSPDKGLRSASMNDILRFGSNGCFSVFSNLSDGNDLVISYSNNDLSRKVKLNSDNVSLSSLSSLLKIIWLTPKEDRLFIDSIVERRVFFDRLVSCFDENHMSRISKLNRLLSERSFALKNKINIKLLDVLDTQITGISVSIAASRIQYISELSYFLKGINIDVSGLLESFILNENASIAEQKYLDYLINNRFLINDKMIIDGVNKTDFKVFNKTLNLPVYLTSTGQQKIVLIDLVLSHSKLINTKLNKKNLILLDEVFSHLDYLSSKKILNSFQETNSQIWITGNDDSKVKEFSNVFYIKCV